MGEINIRTADFLLRSENQKVLDAFARAPVEVGAQMGESFYEIAHELERRVIKSMRPWSPGAGPGRKNIGVRTGKLRQTVQGIKTGNRLQNLAVTLKAGSRDAPYAPIQEFGGTIRPKKRYLRIPLPVALTPGGDTKGKYQIYNQGGKWMTGAGKPTFIRGRAIMVEEGGKAMPIHALAESVEIPARLGLGRTIADSGKMMRQQIIGAVRRGLKLRRKD